MAQNYWIGVDIGGTFTDIVLLNRQNGDILVYKHPSTPGNPEVGAVAGIKELLSRNNIPAKNVAKIVHGTTVATNAVIERTGAKTALLVTEGFRDLLEIRRQDRPDLYNIRKDKPKPLVPRDLVFEVSERMQYDGEVLTPLDELQLEALARSLAKAGVEAAAVCLLHAYRNGAHESRLYEYLSSALPSVELSLSHEILPEFKEYERASTTATNAYIAPVMRRYLTRFNADLAKSGFGQRVLVMQSNGGITTSEQAANRAVETLVSGPAAGVLAGLAFSPNKNIITADMGGTSFDVALVQSGKPRFTFEGEIAGLELRLPRIDVNTIGAGGGSIAWIDSGGILRIGPRSAGAAPGPACYGRGGEEPTVTDAHAVLGRINPNYLLAGEMEIDVSAAERAIADKIAKHLGLSVLESAQGIVDVVNANMVKGIRRVSVERGHDPSDFDLVSFGGAGPLHAMELAEELQMRQVVVPYHPGVNSAVGLLAADYRYTKVRSLLRRLEKGQLTPVNRMLQDLREEIRVELEHEGFSRSDTVYEYHLYLRYAGQGSELESELPGGSVSNEILPELLAAFATMHEKEFGYSRNEEPIELVNVRVTGVIQGGVRSVGGRGDRKAPGEPQGRRKVYFGRRYHDTPVYRRDDLCVRQNVSGPAIIEQLDSTIVVPPGCYITVDEQSNLIGRRERNG